MTRTLGRMLLVSMVAVVTLHGRCGAAAPGPPAAVEESSMGRILELQKKLNERIDYELLVPTALDKGLDELLTRSNIPWTFNTTAFTAANLDPKTLRTTAIDKTDKMKDVTRATVLKRLLEKIPSDGGKGAPTYLIRPDSIEITTVGARLAETEGARAASSVEDNGGVVTVPPPLVYAAFEDVPLQDALREMAHNTETVIVLDARVGAKTKVTAELPGVPLDVALQLLTDMGGLKFVHIANVYYVTSPKNAERLQKEEDRRRPAATALANPAHSAEQVANRSSADRKDGAAAVPTLVQPLLALTADAPAPPAADEETALGGIPAFQKMLNEKIDYELLVPTTLDKALNEQLTQNGMPWTVNEAAFLAAQQDRDVMKKTQIDKIDKMIGVTRATVLKKLLAYLPHDEFGAPTYILRPDAVEITTFAAVRQEFYPGRHETHLPPLAYGSFKETPLREALAELARTTQRSVVVDAKSAEEAKSKVTAEFLGVPADTAVQVLADMAGLELVRLEGVYYVTSPANARLLRKEINRRRLEFKKILGDEDPLDLPVIP